MTRTLPKHRSKILQAGGAIVSACPPVPVTVKQVAQLAKHEEQITEAEKKAQTDQLSGHPPSFEKLNIRRDNYFLPGK